MIVDALLDNEMLLPATNDTLLDDPFSEKFVPAIGAGKYAATLPLVSAVHDTFWLPPGALGVLLLKLAVVLLMQLALRSLQLCKSLPVLRG